jgi:hypothetical protein
MNHPQRLLAEIPALMGELPSRVGELPSRMSELPAFVSELPARVSDVPVRVKKATRPRRRAVGPKRIVMLVVVLGAVGAVLYVIRSRRSALPTGSRDWHVHEESDESAQEMRVREAGSATA